MPRITISDDQADALEALRTDIDREVGPYGHVRPRDALQFLLDEHAGDDGSGREAGATQSAPGTAAESDDAVDGSETDRLERAIEAELEPMSYQELQHLAGRTDGVEPKGKQPELRGRLAASVAASVRDELLDEAPDSDTDPADDDGADDDGADDLGTPDTGSENGDAGDGPVPDEASTGHDDGIGAPDPLQRARRLLDDHEDQWREVNDDRAKYEVTLPDGRTEPARTKDDVRALLMKHY